MGTNCLGPFLLNHYLEPTLKKTAAENNSPLGVRVVWLSSMIAASVPKGGIMMHRDGSPKVIKVQLTWEKQRSCEPMLMLVERHGKLHAKQGRKRLHGSRNGSALKQRWHHQRGMSSGGSLWRRAYTDDMKSVNPGLLNTELQRHVSSIQRMIMVGRDPSPVFWILLALLRAFLSDPFHQSVMFKEPKYGAYSELFAALSPQIDSKKSGAFILPWGRFGHIPDHIQQSIDNGKAASFYSWCDQETKPYQ